MRLRVAVRWAGDTIEDRLHEARELRIGSGPTDEVTVAGDAHSPIRFVELRALTVAELPAALVESIEWPDGEVERIDEDRRVTLGGSRRAGRITLRRCAGAEIPTELAFELGHEAARRRDVALVAWAGGAMALAAYLGVTLVAVQSSMQSALVAPRALRSGEATELLRIRFHIDPKRELVDDGKTIGHGDRGRGGTRRRKRPGATEASRYAELLIAGFERYVASDLDSAHEKWSEATAVDSERPEAWINLAQIAKRRSNAEDERRLLRVALEHDPERCEALVSMALVETRLGELADGHKTIGRARVSCGSDQGFVLINEAALFAAAGKLDDAFTRLEAAVGKLPSDDKREEALADLQQEPLFAQLRGDARYAALVSALRTRLDSQDPV